MGIKIYSFEEYNAKTVTMVFSLSSSIDIGLVCKYLEITHLYEGKKKLKIENSRDISYYGTEEIIISIASKGGIKRGIRKKDVMHNMVSGDIQCDGKNTHFKLSPTKITLVGAKSKENGEKTANVLLNGIINVQKLVNYIKNCSEKVLKKTFKHFMEVSANCVDFTQMEYDNFTVPREIDLYLYQNFVMFAQDIDNISELPKLGNLLSELISLKTSIYSEELYATDILIRNSIYQVNLGEKLFIPLHKIAVYLFDKGISIEFHNWVTNSIKICFPVRSDREEVKAYKHRIKITEKGSMRVISPSSREESYDHYLLIAKAIKKIYEGDIKVDYEKYIVKEHNEELY